MKRKLFLFAITLLMGVQASWAQVEDISFTNRTWDVTQQTVTEFLDTRSCQSIASWTSGDGWPTMTSDGSTQGWFYVPAHTTVTFSKRPLAVVGEVHLVLCNGSELVCQHGLKVQLSDNAVLHIYNQTGGPVQGRLTSHNEDSDGAGIGSIDDEHPAGTIHIHGGVINAKGNKNAAGIGGGYRGHGGPVYIYGGEVTAQGGNDASGIGGGYAGNACHGDMSTDFLTLYGGKVTATGGTDGAGIGGGQCDYSILNSSNIFGGGCGKVTIYGGEVYAQGGTYASGIGTGGNSSWSYGSPLEYGDIAIHGGYVEATGGKNGAGIGGGYYSGNTGSRLAHPISRLLIDGGEVLASGGEDGSGIGGGCYGKMFDVTISGGKVTAQGSGNAAGIGGSSTSSYTRTLTINSGEVYAVGSGIGAGIGGAKRNAWLLSDGHGGDFNVNINGGTVEAIAGNGKACGIGGASQHCDGCNVSIKGGSIKVQKSGEGTYPIGGIDTGDAYTDGKLEFGAGVVVAKKESGVYMPVSAAERKGTCRDASVDVIRIEECTHGGYSYTSDADDSENHNKICHYCNYSEKEPHQFTGDDQTCFCGIDKNSFNVYSVSVYTPAGVSSTLTSQPYDRATIQNVVAGKTFVLPTSTVNGLAFQGWVVDDNSRVLMQDGDEPLTLQAGSEITITGTTKVYARYIYDTKPEWTWTDDLSSASVRVHVGGTIVTVQGDDKVTVSKNFEEDDATGDRVQTYTATAKYTYKGYTYTMSNSQKRYVTSLADAGINMLKILDLTGQKASIVIKGRTLYKDGSWNTLCLPFDLTDFTGTPLEGATVKTLRSSSFSNGTLTLNFEDVTSIEAGVPFIVKWNDGSDIVDPEFRNVTIESEYHPVETDYCLFWGLFNPLALEANDDTRLYMGADSKLYYPTAAMDINAFRGFFELTGINAGDPLTGINTVNEFVLDFGDERTTSIALYPTATSNDEDGKYFTLDGRQLNGRPTQKGIYIHNGKKIVVK